MNPRDKKRTQQLKVFKYINKISSFQEKKKTRTHVKKQEDISSHAVKRAGNRNWERAQMSQLTDKSSKVVIITMFKEVKENLTLKSKGRYEDNVTPNREYQQRYIHDRKNIKAKLKSTATQRGSSLEKIGNIFELADDRIREVKSIDIVQF